MTARDRARSLELEPEAGSSRGAGPDDPSAPGSSWQRRRRAALRSGLSAQIALARRESPARGAQIARASVTLVQLLPHTLAALTAGLINERRAELVVRGVSHLDPELRAQVDAEVIGANGPAEGGVATWGDREVERRVKACADRLDADAAVERARIAVKERRVSMRPIPDTMAIVSAVLPVAQAVAVHAALTAAAATAKASGDGRTKGQVMADTLVERATGQSPADDVAVEVQVVITDRALIAGDSTPAHVPGYGPVPAGWARELLTRDLNSVPDRTASVPPDPSARRSRVWFRRLFTHPGTGTLVAMDSSLRLFPAALRRYHIARGGLCRTPWCDAPISHADHVTPHAGGGRTADVNGQGLCARCNLVKEEHGWSASLLDPGPTAGSTQPHTVATTTPTGHAYTSTASPMLPGHLEPPAVAEPSRVVLIELYRSPRVHAVSDPDSRRGNPFEHLAQQLAG